ncbi:MAG: response regulator [Oligoflexia bacterium]|nr:response regulator [Oligoflexia bacterium]
MTNILFIDDDKVTLKLVKDILESSGYSVVTSTDPRDGLDKLEREVFDMVITDANMPGGVSGYELIKTIRGKPKFAHIPIAMLTGRRDKKDIQLGLDSGADDYIIKPIDPMILLGKIQALLKKKSVQVPTTSFPEGPVRRKAQWDVDTQITYISERGLTLRSPLFAPMDTKVKVNSEFFQQIGIEPPILRVTGYTRDPSNAGLYFISANFIGLNDTELQKIRHWLNSNLASLKKSS